MEVNKIIQKCIFRLSWISGVHNICMHSWDACSIGFKLLIFATILLVFTLALYWIYKLIMLQLHAREEFELLSTLVLRVVSSWPFCRSIACRMVGRPCLKPLCKSLRAKTAPKLFFCGWKMIWLALYALQRLTECGLDLGNFKSKGLVTSSR